MNQEDLTKTVGETIQDFYTENNFGKDGGINKKIAWIKFGNFSVPIPNLEGHISS